MVYFKLIGFGQAILVDLESQQMQLADDAVRADIERIIALPNIPGTIPKPAVERKEG